MFHKKSTEKTSVAGKAESAAPGSGVASSTRSLPSLPLSTRQLCPFQLTLSSV